MDTELKAGRELDKLVGKLVMGYTIYHYDKGYRESCFYQLMDRDFEPVADRYGEQRTEELAWGDAPRFSTDIKAAWQVYEFLEARGIIRVGNGDGDSKDVDFIADSPLIFGGDRLINAHITAESYPLAICLAALKATGNL